MTSETNAYSAVIADLKKRRDELDAMIAKLETLASGGSTSVVRLAGSKEDDAGGRMGDGGNPYLGKSIINAAKDVLQKKRAMMTPAEITKAIQGGGLVLSGDNPGNTVASVLHRRSKKHGDVVSPKRGYWGLKDWYPGRNFNKKASDTAETDKGGEEDFSNQPNVSEPPSEQSRVVPLRSGD